MEYDIERFSDCLIYLENSNVKDNHTILPETWSSPDQND